MQYTTIPHDILTETNNEQITRMYNNYHAVLLRFCWYKLSSQEKANDVVADTFGRTWRYLVSGNSIVNEKSFLYTTARHLIIDEYRKKKSSSLDLLLSSGYEVPCVPKKETGTSFDGQLVLQELYRLPKIYSDVMVMRYVNDYSVKDISLIINNSENYVSVKIHRGILQLRKMCTLQDVLS